MRALATTLAAGASIVCLSLPIARDAFACGACFVPPDSPTVVSGHRMVMSVSPVQSVLWDQIQYQGEPEDFAWVLPVKPGARVEEATDAFFEALEATTQTRVTGEPVNCGGSFDDDGSSGSDGCSGGCSAASSGDGEEAQSADGGVPEDPVEVVHQGSVGPYETVTLSTSTPGALNAWLGEHGYNVDTTSQPIIDHYVAEGFDFIALRLQPGQGVKQMKPVRVVTPGAGMTLPLRMVAIGTGAQTPIVLYLIGEGRYTIDNLTEATIDLSELTWDYATSSSNYEQLRTAALGANGGASFVATFAHQRFFGTELSFSQSSGPTVFPSLYAQQAVSNGEAINGCSIPMANGWTVVGNPCPDGVPIDSDSCTGVEDDEFDARNLGCEGAYDMSMALIGMHPADVWVTRLEANLPREALATDLDLRAVARQFDIPNEHLAPKSVNQDKACEGFNASFIWERPKLPPPSYRLAPFAIGGVGLLLLMRRLARARLRLVAVR